MAKIENLLLVLHLLISRRSVPLDVIVRECNISERTAFRYLRSLEMAGFPLDRESGNLGYRLISRNGALASLSPSELSAVYLGVELLESILSPSQLDVFRRVKLKLESYITAEVRQELSTLVHALVQSGDSGTIREHLIVSLLKIAQLQNLRVRLYHSDGKSGIIVSELNKPTLQFEREWKLTSEEGEDHSGIRLADIVDIEFS